MTKLSAILSAAVGGYSQLTGEDEKATVYRILKHNNLIAPRPLVQMPVEAYDKQTW